MFVLALAFAILAGSANPAAMHTVRSDPHSGDSVTVELEQPSAQVFRVIRLADVSGGIVGDFFPLDAPDGERDALLFMKHGGTVLFISLDFIEVDTVNAEVRIRVADAQDPSEQPTVYRTIYVDRDGRTHEVITDCKIFTTTVGCAAAHGLAVIAMEVIFPRGKGLVDFNEVNMSIVVLPGFMIRMMNVVR